MQRLFYRDLEAFRTLYERYGDLVYSTVLRTVRDVHVAQDLVQELFLKLWNRPDSYVAQRGRLASWLATVARNRAVDEIRARRRRDRHEAPRPEGPERELPAPYQDDPVLGMELADQRRLIIGALGELPPEQRQAIELAYFEGLTQQEIAQRLSQPLGTIKTRTRLGMQKLRAALAPHLKEGRR